MKHENWNEREPQSGEQALLAALHRCGRFIHHRVHSARGQGSILKLLAERQRIGQKELLGLLNIQPGSLSETLTKLERRGLIQRERDEADKRRVLVTVTNRGLRVLEEQSEEIPARELFTALEEGERQELLGLLTKLGEDWDARFGIPEHHRRRGAEESSAEEPE